MSDTFGLDADDKDNDFIIDPSNRLQLSKFLIYLKYLLMSQVLTLLKHL